MSDIGVKTEASQLECIEISGGQPLCGSIRIQGSKNAALPILAGTLLHEGKTILQRCPRIADVMCMLQILEELGCRVTWEGEDLHIDAGSLRDTRISENLGERMRSSIILLGSLLGRIGEAHLPYPGGCTIGKRPIDLHLAALRAMNAVIEEERCVLHGSCDRLCGRGIHFPFPSVGATENVILAAVLAEGVTVIHNAAMEPEIMELARFLIEKGALIEGAGTPYIRIEGVKGLCDSTYTMASDRIVTGTYLCAAAATRSQITLADVPVSHLGAVLQVLEMTGAHVGGDEHALHIDAGDAIRPIPKLVTETYPGFPTDLQSPLMALLCTAEGESCISERIFESRYKDAEELVRMGAQIEIKGSSAHQRRAETYRM